MILKFSTAGCSPCYALGLVLDSMMVEYTEVDISEKVSMAIEYRVMSVPTLVNTETGARLVGFNDKKILEEWLNDNQG